MPYPKAMFAGAMAFALIVSAAPMRAEPLQPLRLADSEADRWSCRGMPRWERERCESDRDREDHRHDRRRDKKVKEGVALGILGLAVGAMIAGAAKDAEKRRQERSYDREEWLDRCAARYRTFDPRSGTFIGRDGRRYYCQ